MSRYTEHRIFFDESTIIADKWCLELIANAARKLLPSKPGYHIFIKLDDYMSSHFYFSVMVGSTPNLPLSLWKTTVIDEYKEPRFECVSKKE